MKKCLLAFLCASCVFLSSCRDDNKQPSPQKPTPVAVSVSYEIPDGMWSWWTKPLVLRDYSATKNRTYVVHTERSGAVSLSIIDHNTNTTKRHIIATNFSPDDHNAGSVVVGNGRVAIFMQGRTIIGASKHDMYYVEFGENEDPTGLKLKSFPFGKETSAGGSNYPNTYNAQGQFFLLSRMDNALGEQWGIVLNSWPLGTFSERKTFYGSTKYTWSYFATNRGTDKNVFPFALGFHPFSGNHYNIYYGEIHRNGVLGQPWDVISKDMVIGNLTTGSGLPFNETSFETVYVAAPGERTRLFNVAENTVVFATFGSDNIATYKYASRRNGKWQVHNVVSGGLPFHGTNVRNYYGGMSISNQDRFTISLSREEAGMWYVERYKSNDEGKTWVKLTGVSYSVPAARPIDEMVSEESVDFNGKLDTVYWFGSYDQNDYTVFLTNLITLK